MLHIEILNDLFTLYDCMHSLQFVDSLGVIKVLTLWLRCNELLGIIWNYLDHEQLKDHGRDFVMNIPSSSHMGGIWERQIRTIRSVLMAILDQSGKTLEISSHRTFLYEVTFESGTLQ